MDIGKRLRQLRTKNSLTLEELASRTELTKGFLSQLERNLTSPSISTLENITEVLGVPLEDFFREDRETRISFSKDDYSVDERDGRKITWLVPDSQKNVLEPILMELQPGTESQEIEPYEGAEFGYVLKGHLDLIKTGTNEAYRLRKGDSFYLEGDYTHKLVNIGREPGIILWVATPSIF